MSGHQFGPGLFSLIFFGSVAAAAAFLLAGPDKAATDDAAFVMDLIPVRSMSPSPEFLSALILAERDRFYHSTLESLPTTVFLFAFILSDSSKGGMALVTAPFILLTAALVLAEDFWGRDVFRVLAIVVGLSFDFVPCPMPK
jgi:hypothetical protein